MAQDVFHADAWTRACNRFTEDLSEDEKRLYFQATPENILYEASAVDKISDDTSRTRKFFKKLQPFVQSIEQYNDALDVFANTYALVMSPLWGGIRIVLHLAREAGQYFERISSMFFDIGEVLPRLHVYERLFPGHERLVQALSVIYCDLIHFCSDAKHALRRVKPSSLTRPWKKFDRQFGDQIEKFRKHQKLVEKEVTTSHMIESAESRSVLLADRMQVTKEHQESELQRTFAALSPVNYEAQLQRLYDMHQKGTCTWVENHPIYREWKRSINSCGLCCSGIPGCGKSVLMSTMVKQQLQMNGGSIVYFFCDYSDPATLLTVNIYRALLKQLYDNKMMSDQVKKGIFEQCERSSHGPNEHDLANYLSESIEARHSLRIMVDGLDECSGKTQDCLSDQVLRWSNVENSVLKVIVTCREEEKPLRLLRTFANLKFDTSILHADIEAFISKSIESCISRGILTVKNKELENSITSKLSEKAQGMFLWVHFQLQDLCEATSDCAIQEILDHLPNGLHDTYVRILERIENGTSQANKDLVQQALQWVAFARRPLTLPESREAVAFGSEDDHWKEDKIPDGDKLIGLCRALVIRDHGNLVRFAHHTVRQHLLRPAVQDESHISPFQFDSHGLSSPRLMNYYFTNVQAEFRLAVGCATYMCFYDFESAVVKANRGEVVTMQQIFKTGGPIAIPGSVGLRRQLSQIPYKFLGGNGDIRMPDIDFSKYGRNVNQPPRAPQEMRDKYALLDYVIQQWPWHTKQRLSKTGLEFNLPHDVYGERTTRQFGGGKEILDMQIGCLPVFQKFWNLILHKNLTFEIRPWGLNQHSGVYGCQGCPPTESRVRPLQGCKWTRLIHWAAEVGHVPLISAIPADMMHHLYHERYHHQTLKIACSHDQPELISFMLTAGIKGVEVLPEGATRGNAQTEDLTLRIRQTPYLVADWIEFCCKSGALDGLIALLDFSEVSRETLLKGALAAASNRRLQVLDRLLEGEIIDGQANSATAMSLLHCAAKRGHASIVAKVLLKARDFDESLQSELGLVLLEYLQATLGMTPLKFANQRSHNKVVQILLDAGANVLVEGGEFLALPHAVPKVHSLLSVSTIDEIIRRPTSIHLAAADGNPNLLSKLLMSDTFEKESNDRGLSPLLSTLIIMENDSPTIALDPLECAAVHGHKNCVSLLLSYVPQLNKSLRSKPKAAYSRALHLAAAMGHEQVVRLLLQNDADPDSTIVGGVTPLHAAAANGKAAIVVFLIEFQTAEPDVYEEVNGRIEGPTHPSWGDTPLQLAINEGHSEAVEKLIEYGADPELGYKDNGSVFNALQSAIKCPKAGIATIKAVCLQTIPRQIKLRSGSEPGRPELSDKDLLDYAIKWGRPEKLQTLFDLELRNGDEVGLNEVRSPPRTPYLVMVAICSDEYQCLEILLASCSYRYDSLMVAVRLARERVSASEDVYERYASERACEVLEKKLAQMRTSHLNELRYRQRQDRI